MGLGPTLGHINTQLHKGVTWCDRDLTDRPKFGACASFSWLGGIGGEPEVMLLTRSACADLDLSVPH
jgi:hypothetical protein